MTVTKEDLPTAITGVDQRLTEIKACDEKAASPTLTAMQLEHAIHSTFAVHKFPGIL
ncbi:hypothetical protein [Rhizobium sp.]|uniref:Type II secretory pathway component PulM n=1 Tax=Rhizobium wenxiniae TaxID=1737357 RepID=A0A7W9Y1S5_9HYPH|nr:type II secretory pathway component PulM [Rhizobium wenxiniae]GGF80714.1 hypothetical protein GCM10010924_04750 [Rhizobium wenxiniae]